MSRRVLGPFNRVEGDLEVQVEIEDGVVTEAWVNSPLFRGFEQILQGKDPRDAMVYTPRICGICSVSQSVAAATALAQAQGLQATSNGQLATNLILAAENIADHLSHFYLFFMPDFARECYQQQSWYADTQARFAAQTGSSAPQMLKARAELLHITGILAGKWPHSLSIQPGGTTRAIESQERIRLLMIVNNFGAFLESQLFGGALEAVAELQSEDDLSAWISQYPDCDFSRFLKIADKLELQILGRSKPIFMSYGAYQNGASHLFKRGIWNQTYQQLDTALITEDITHSWMRAQTEPRHPFDGSTIPYYDEDSHAYTWCKAPRLDGQVVEVGALARQIVNGHPLIKTGGNVRNRVIARLLELALLVPEMKKWCRELKPKEPFCSHAAVPQEAQGIGLVEAARGSLGHWVRIHNGNILNYQIIAPTTWNFSPRDQQNVPGVLEQALLGTPVDKDGSDSVAIQHVVRSFDPCMVCTVH